MTEDEERRYKAKIIKSIRSADHALREKYPILQHQDGIGLSITLISAGGMVAVTLAYLQGWISAWVAIPVNAVLASFLHEIEHDLIHNIYFRNSRWVQNVLFWIVWVFRGNIVSPWVRRALHWNHHKASGRPDDVEERMIGNGMPMGWRRLITMMDQPLSLLINQGQLQKDAPHIFHQWRLILGSFPVQFIFQTLWYHYLAASFLVYGARVIGYLGIEGITPPGWVHTFHAAVTPVAVVWLLPNFIRQASLQFISSSMHYYGNVESITQQTQILNPWYLLPFQAVSCNFGSTHCIHHFVVNQPFYLRQMVASAVHPVMRECGVPLNDTSSNSRANAFLTMDGLSESRP